jgi:diphosphomevalonate decarboxylase
MFKNQDFILENKEIVLSNFQFKAQAPSNIALIKYWGKLANQIPANPSLSFTLNNCKTTTSVILKPKENEEKFSFDFYFEGKLKESFRPKIESFFSKTAIYLPFLTQFHFEIHSENTFPHSSGIASSASAMAALSLCMMQIEKESNPEISEDYYYAKASFLARLGSGSACRSIKGNIVAWGETVCLPEASNLYGVEIKNFHPVYKTFQDTVLLVDKGEKQVSSTLGHDLMNNHPYANRRFEQAHENLEKLLSILQTDDLEAFIKIVESEALTLHAMMMTSMPYFILMKPNTLEIIQKIWNFRQKTNLPVCFTLDAGANVHLLHPEKIKQEVQIFITNELQQHCQNNHFIHDLVGNGGRLL